MPNKEHLNNLRTQVTDMVCRTQEYQDICTDLDKQYPRDENDEYPDEYCDEYKNRYEDLLVQILSQRLNPTFI